MSQLHANSMVDVENINHSFLDNHEVIVPLGLLRMLLPIYQEHSSKQVVETRQSRIELIISTLFPIYRERLPEKDKPIRHPGKLHWWNGADILSQNTQPGGSEYVQVRSYVQDSRHEDYGVDIPSEWITCENPVQAIQEWCKKEKARLAEDHKRKVVKYFEDSVS